MQKFKEMKVVIPIPVSVNQYLMCKGKRMIKTKETRKCEKELKLLFSREALLQKWVMPEDESRQIEIHYKFYFDKKNRDTNNYYKIPLDSIVASGVICHDDNVLTEHVDSLLYDTKNPRIEMTFKVSDKVGIFEDEWDFNFFESKCTTCSKYREGKCSILNKARSGYIQEEIEEYYEDESGMNYDCMKYKERIGKKK